MVSLATQASKGTTMSLGRRSIVPVVLLFTAFSTLQGSLETWGSWGSCSKTCGSGIQSRSRACNNTAPLTGGTNCSVTLSETQSCNAHACSSCSSNVQADIVFVMDASGSVGDVNFQTMKEFVRDQVDAFDIDANNIRVGVLKFSSTANTEFNLNDFLDKDAIKNNIMNINYTGGKTYTGDALNYMRTTMFTTANGDREGVNNFGVILTDGQSNNSTHTADQARAAHNANITIFSIGIGSSSGNVDELRDMASYPDSDYLFTVANFSALSGIHTAFQAKACVPAPPPGCVETYTSWSDTIRTPTTVNSSHECTFIIRQPQSYVIYLQFEHFHVGNNTINCTTNYVEVRDGDEEGSPLLGQRYCGTDTPPLLTSSQNMTWIRYVTDGSDIAAGFTATYWRAEPCPTVVLTEQNGTFTSPSFPANYRDYMYCTWNITAETDNVIRLTFTNFSLESKTDCGYDWVDILDGATSRGRFCGESGPGTLTSSSNRVTVTFKTDFSITKPGFFASYVTYPSSGYPPECSSTQTNVSFPDSAAVGTCSTVTAQCSTSGPDTTLDVTNSTDGPVRWTISQGNMDTDSSLVFTVCVTDVLFHFIGQYEAILNVSNSTDVSSVTWSVTIDDVNQPPAFYGANYNIRVSESTVVQTTIAQVPLVTSRASADTTTNDVITVWDPDNVTAGFEFKGINVRRVNVTYPNSSQVTTTDQNGLPIYLRNDSGPPFSFLTRSPLSAGVQLSFTLQAEDEQGLVSRNTVVTIVVSDVNEAPVCASDKVNLTIDLIKQVNDFIYNVSCTDNDVNSTLSSLTYHEYTTPDSDYDYFSISSRGEIAVEQRLPLNVTTLTYTIYAIDGGGLVANFTLHLDINHNPPECSSTQNNVSFPDSAAVGTCSTVNVQCSTSGPDTTLDVTNSTDGPVRWTISQGIMDTDSSLVFTVCVTDVLYHFIGQYEAILNVSNSTGVTSVTWSVTIDDVNQPPAFLSARYNIQVSESTAVQTTIAQVSLTTSRASADMTTNDVFTVWDPDNVTAGFEFKGINVQSVNWTYPNLSQVTTTDQSSLPIYLRNDSGPPFFFLTRSPLSAGVQLAFTLQAEDEQGAVGSNTVVTFVVSDVNQAPVCSSNNVYLTIGLTKQVNDSIFTVTCRDFDVNSTLSSLTYLEYTTSDSDYDYFSITSGGEISLEQRLPLNVTTMTYKVYVIDGGGLVANATLHLVINRSFPPTCPFPSRNLMTLPETANTTQCDTLTIACSHMTELDHYALTFNVSLVYNTSLFQVDHQKKEQPPSHFNVTGCPNIDLLGHAGSYTLSFTVSSELGTYSNTLGIVVTDVNQPPQFDQDSYMFNVSEYTSSGATVARVVVGSNSGAAGWNEIRVTDPDTRAAFVLDAVQETGVSLFYANGSQAAVGQSRGIVYTANDLNFTVTGTLTPEQYYVFLLTARDRDGLSATATVTISIYDVNEPPTCPSFFETRANLTSSIGSTIFTLNCVDNDVKAEYKSVTYTEIQRNAYDYFDVSPTGDVTLTSIFPADVNRLRYEVQARDGGVLTTGVTLFVDINRNFGPECTPSSQVDFSFQEDARSGACSQTLANCTDTSGRNLPMTVRVISDSTQGEIRVNDNRGSNQSTVALEACVAVPSSRLMSVGQFEITVEVNNTLNVTQVTFNVTVTDVNQPPFFAKSAYLTTVPELLSGGSTTTIATVRSPSDSPPSNPDVVDIVRDDPDQQAKFDIVSIQYVVRAEYTNRTSYEGDFNATGPITMVGNSVVRTDSLSPDLIYYVNLTVKDGQGISDNTTLQVKVTDVNEPPSCPLKPNTSLDLLESAQTVVASVSCTDSDYNDAFRNLSYFSYQEADHGYFDVETSGDVRLVTSVPRDAIQLVLKVYARDGGGLEDNTTLAFIIDRNYPPDCFPSYVPPDGVWEYDKCFRVYPNCSDPTTPDGDKQFLTYTFTGSWTNGFRQTAHVNVTHDYAEFCFTLRSDANFTIHLASSNGLGNHTWDQDVIVTYKVASPKFTSNRYNAVPVNETAAVGFLVETVQALVDGQTVPLVYTFTGAGMFEQFFAVDSNTGNITVLKDLSPLAETEQNTYVMATDPATNLTHSVPVTVRVNDVNQPPTCSPAVFDVTVLWNVTINDVIAIVNCTDLDPRDAFSQLSYKLDTAGSSMWKSNQTAVKLRSRALLDPLKSQYIVHVVATDTSFTATTTVTINIDRTPPYPVLRVSSVTTSTANITWTFDQQYLPVISNFTIAIRNSSNSNTIPQIFVVIKNVLFYVITGLNPEQTYGVVVTANGFDANVTSDEISFTTQAVPILTQVSAEIKLSNETWSRDLLNNTSVAFIELRNKIESTVHNRLGSVLGYVSTKVRSFRAGSVYADIAVTSNQSLFNTSDLKTELLYLVRSGSVGSLPVDSSYFQFYNGAYYIAGTSVDYASEGKVSNSSQGFYVIVTGYDVTATCSSRTPGVSEPKFDWTLGGLDMTSMQSSGRYVISLPNRSDNDPFKFVSSVRIKEILTTESGQLVCNVTAADNTVDKQVALQVVTKLETILNPSSSIVSRGNDVNLVCARRAGYEVLWQAILYTVESAGGQVQVVNKTEKDKQANFTIRGVSSTVRYRCNISDSIATAVSNEATIFIPEPATRNCPEDEDWDETPGGNTVRLSCPRGYADGGLQYRQCGTDGQWREPDTSQCVRQELEDLKTTIDQIGTNTTNETTKDVVEKLQNSTGGSRPLLSGDVTAAVDILDKVANFTVNTEQTPGEGELETFVMIADNVLHASIDVWQDQTTKALSLVNAVDRMGKASSRTFNSSGSQRPITSNKIVLQVGRSNRNDIVFPIPSQTDNYPQWVTAAKNSAFLSKDAFNASMGEVGYSAVIYRNLSNVFSGQVNQFLTGLSKLSINSPILALSLALDDVRLLKPVRLTFDHIMDNFSSASCQFLDFSASAKGIWSTKGCRVTKSNSTMTACECDHLTNFAVLMSPYRPANEVADVLNIFSIVGCSISIFCLILTLVIYFIFWRYVKSDRSVLLVHLCVVLVLAYVTFLAGVNRVENEIVCTVVAGLLHYLWLVVFFLMLCEGIDIFITIVIVFPTKSALAWLLLMAYGVPVIIVGVSMGVTKSEGYGGTVFCWLSLEEGLLWAFVGPAVAALVANFVVIVKVIHTLLNSRVMITKDKRERAKSVVKAICVMTPILGLSWIFGVMSVNDKTVVFQILFVVFNSLQGLMIFILHCLLSKQVREGLQHKRRRYQANSKSAGDSTSKYVTQKQTSESNISSNDLDRKTISPFLQVDRQVQQMASKLSKLDSSNFMTANDTPKVMALKNPVAGITRTPPAQEQPLNIQPNDSTMDGRDDQQRRLDHVYGAGARMSDYNKMMGGAYARSRGGRFSLSEQNIGITPALRNPVYHDAVPALSPTDRWVRVAQSTKPQQQQQRRSQQHLPVRHPSQPAPFQQPRPSPFYRLAASADHLGSSYYQPFATPGQIHKRHGNKRQPTQVDAKPSMWYQEPSVGYQ